MRALDTRPQPMAGNDYPDPELTPETAREYVVWAHDALSDADIVRLARVMRDWIQTAGLPVLLVQLASPAVFFFVYG